MDRETKSRMAEDRAISRFKVARLIDEAIEEGLVRFEIDEAGDLDARLSERLREKYSLRSALVLAGPDLPCGALIEPLWRVAASLLAEIVTYGCVYGVARRRTIAAAASATTRFATGEAVQPGMGLSRQ